MVPTNCGSSWRITYSLQVVLVLDTSTEYHLNHDHHVFFLRNNQKLCSSWCSSPIKHVFVVYKPPSTQKSASPGRLLVDHVDEWFSLFFIIYRCVVGFSPVKLFGRLDQYFFWSHMNWMGHLGHLGHLKVRKRYHSMSWITQSGWWSGTCVSYFSEGWLNHQQLMSWIATFVSWRLHVWQSSGSSGSDAESPGQLEGDWR